MGNTIRHFYEFNKSWPKLLKNPYRNKGTLRKAYQVLCLYVWRGFINFINIFKGWLNKVFNTFIADFLYCKSNYNGRSMDAVDLRCSSECKCEALISTVHRVL